MPQDKPTAEKMSDEPPLPPNYSVARLAQLWPKIYYPQVYTDVFPELTETNQEASIKKLLTDYLTILERPADQGGVGLSKESKDLFIKRNVDKITKNGDNIDESIVHFQEMMALMETKIAEAEKAAKDKLRPPAPPMAEPLHQSKPKRHSVRSLAEDEPAHGLPQKILVENHKQIPSQSI